MMKKKFILTFCVVQTVLSFAQEAVLKDSVRTIVQKEEASTPNNATLAKNALISNSLSSLLNYIEVPVNEATGTPDINIPLLDVPMPDHTVNYPISLRYNVKDYENSSVSDVGQGWSLLGPSLIYRKNTSTQSECRYGIRSSFNLDEDVYYYTLLGSSGKFVLKKENNEYRIINLNPGNNIRIELADSQNPFVYHPAGFIITTDDGYKYYFDSIGYYDQIRCSGDTFAGLRFTYHLKSLVNPANSELAYLFYQATDKKNASGDLLKSYHKINLIHTTKGDVYFNFLYDESMENSVNDPYKLESITLKNAAGEVEYTYGISTYNSSYTSDKKRVLERISKMDKKNVPLEQNTVFRYENNEYLKQDGILEGISLPTGGFVDYIYEDHTYPNASVFFGNKGKRINAILYSKSLSYVERAINYDYEGEGQVYHSELDKFDTGDPISYILYKNVKIWESRSRKIWEPRKGYTRKTFMTPSDYPVSGSTWPYYNMTRWGLPSKEEIYDEQNTLLATKDFNYEFGEYQDPVDLKIYSGFSSRLAYISATRQKEKSLFPGGKVVESTSETKINKVSLKPDYIKSVVNGNIKEKFFTYPVGLPDYAKLEERFIIRRPMIVEEKENGKLISRSKLLFNYGFITPTSVLVTNIADGSTKETLKVPYCDITGRPLLVYDDVGIPTAYIYGYNDNLLIAKIEGATYDQVSNLVQKSVSASDTDNKNATQASEDALRSELEAFRNDPALSGYKITTYTYDPLVGVKSITLPSGITEYYSYDSAGRLQFVKDQNGSILQDYQYRYRNY